MKNLKLVLILIPFLLPGCATLRGQINPSHENFKDIKTVKFIDNTKPLVLATTTSREFFPLLKTGFESIGIQVCAECKADALVNIDITHYGVLSARSGTNISQIRFLIDITKNGESIYKRVAGTKSRSSLKITAAESITPIINVISEARKN